LAQTREEDDAPEPEFELELLIGGSFYLLCDCPAAQEAAWKKMELKCR
jgi:hypothetical protein